MGQTKLEQARGAMIRLVSGERGGDVVGMVSMAVRDIADVLIVRSADALERLRMLDARANKADGYASVSAVQIDTLDKRVTKLEGGSYSLKARAAAEIHDRMVAGLIDAFNKHDHRPGGDDQVDAIAYGMGWDVNETRRAATPRERSAKQRVREHNERIMAGDMPRHNAVIHGVPTTIGDPLAQRYESIAAERTRMQLDIEQLAAQVRSTAADNSRVCGKLSAAEHEMMRLQRELDSARKIARVAESEAIAHREARSSAEHELALFREERNRLTVQLDGTIKMIGRIATAAGVSHGSAKDTTERTIQRVEADRGALALANKEADRLRVAINPFIPSQFQGQDISTALVNTLTAGGVRTNSDAVRKLEDKIVDLTKRNDVQARERSEIEEAHWQAVQEYRTANPGPYPLPPVRTQVVGWLLDTVRKLEAQLTNLVHEKAHAIDDYQKRLEDERAATGKVMQERDAAIARSKAHSETIAQLNDGANTHRDRVRQLEAQAARRDKLEAQRLETAEAFGDRVKTVLDEAFELHPVMSPDHALTMIEIHLSQQRGALWRRLQVVEVVLPMVGPNGVRNVTGATIDGIVAAVDRYNRTEAEAMKRDDEQRAAAMRAIDRDDDEGDCQAGTCDCPTSDLGGMIAPAKIHGAEVLPDGRIAIDGGHSEPFDCDDTGSSDG